MWAARLLATTACITSCTLLVDADGLSGGRAADAGASLPDSAPAAPDAHAESDAPPGPTYSEAVLADGPLAYWRLGERGGGTATDTMGAHPGVYLPNTRFGVDGAVA